MIDDSALDALLDAIGDNVDRIYLCSQDPTTLTEATTTYDLGVKTTPTIGALGNGTPNGRKRSVSAITDGSVTDTGTATHVAYVENGVKLWATRALSAPQAVTSGNVWTLTEHDIRVPDPA